MQLQASHSPHCKEQDEIEALVRSNCSVLKGIATNIWAHGVVVSHPLSMREALGSIPSVSTFESDAFSSAANTSPHMDYCSTRRASDSVSEWLRRWTRNPLGSARRGSNPLAVVFWVSLIRDSVLSVFTIQIKCACRESNPGHKHGRLV